MDVNSGGVGYVLKNIDTDTYYAGNCGQTRREVKQQACEDLGRCWKTLKKHGFRVVRAQFEIKEQP